MHHVMQRRCIRRRRASFSTARPRQAAEHELHVPDARPPPRSARPPGARQASAKELEKCTRPNHLAAGRYHDARDPIQGNNQPRYCPIFVQELDTMYLRERTLRWKSQFHSVTRTVAICCDNQSGGIMIH
eukprot:gene15929-biopygen6714